VCFSFIGSNSAADIFSRYFFTDFVFLSSLRRRGITHIYVSYDIACRWEINLPTRCSKYSEELTFHLENVVLVVLIPKFHLPAHSQVCWSRYSFNFVPGSARVDGEAVERFWSGSNPVATSTREMAPGKRQDFLNHRWNMSNFKKVIEIGGALSRRLRLAVKGFEDHTKELEQLTDALDPTVIAQLRCDVEDYHKDPVNKRDPYRVLIQEFNMSDLQKQLRSNGITLISGGNSQVSDADFLIMGLDIERQQYVYSLKYYLNDHN